jgi:hypothetical protein
MRLLAHERIDAKISDQRQNGRHHSGDQDVFVFPDNHLSTPCFEAKALANAG